VGLLDEHLEGIESALVWNGATAGDIAAVWLIEVEPSAADRDVKSLEAVISDERLDVSINFVRVIVEVRWDAVHDELRHKGLIGARPTPLVAEIGERPLVRPLRLGLGDAQVNRYNKK